MKRLHVGGASLARNIRCCSRLVDAQPTVHNGDHAMPMIAGPRVSSAVSAREDVPYFNSDTPSEAAATSAGCCPAGRGLAPTPAGAGPAPAAASVTLRLRSIP